MQMQTYNPVETQLEINNLDLAKETDVFIETDKGMVQAKKHKGIFNISKNSLGCIASEKYNLIQHRELVRSLFEAMKNLNIPFEYKITSFNHRLIVDVSFPQTKLYVQVGEEFLGGLRIVNSYNKTTGLMILPKLLRLACSNGMVVGNFLKGYTIRHNQTLVKDFESLIEKTLANMVNSCDKLKAMINNCIGDSVEWKLAGEILKNLIKREKHIKAIKELIRKNLENKQVKLVSRWDIYNAITNYISHGEQIKPNLEMWMQNKAQTLLETPLVNLMPVHEIKLNKKSN